jgi:hypothetical protein
MPPMMPTMITRNTGNRHTGTGCLLKPASVFSGAGALLSFCASAIVQFSLSIELVPVEAVQKL